MAWLLPGDIACVTSQKQVKKAGQFARKWCVTG
jgi:hypothetical protein